MALTTTEFDAATVLDTPEAIEEYLTAAFESGDTTVISHAFGVVARARGMSLLAGETGLTRQALYKALSSGGNPEFSTVMKVAHALGFRLEPRRLEGFAESDPPAGPAPPRPTSNDDTMRKQPMADAGRIRCGIGGWTFEPWRGVFYPPGLSQKKELEYASRQLTAIEINGTYYSSFKPDSWAKWREATPEGFKFAVKASRFCVNRKKLTDAKPSIEIFLGQGLTELGDRLGPILWQFMATKNFDYDDFASFFDLLPDTLGGLPLRHVIEVRNGTFADPKFVGLCRERNVTICASENENYPLIPDITGDLVYLRLISASDTIETGYDARDLDLWADRFKAYAAGDIPAGFTPVDRTGPEDKPRDVYAFVIHEGKVRAPAAAMQFIKRVDPGFVPG